MFIMSHPCSLRWLGSLLIITFNFLYDLNVKHENFNEYMMMVMLVDRATALVRRASILKLFQILSNCPLAIRIKKYGYSFCIYIICLSLMCKACKTLVPDIPEFVTFHFIMHERNRVCL